MINKPDKNEVRKNRHLRIRSKLKGTAKRPRLNVYRSTSHIYAQIINDEEGRTLVASSTLDKQIDIKGKTKVEAAELVGIEIAKKALAAGIEEVVFDRGGYLYTGRIKALADGARQAGLKF